MKKIIICVVSLIVTVVAVFSVYTLAFLSDSAGEDLVVVAVGGNISGKLIESTVPAGGGEPVLGSTPVQIMPGTKVQKSVCVENTGTLPMYLRMTVDKQFELSQENAGSPTDPSLVTVTLNTAYWEERDGFYYYKQPLSPGKTTEPLFTEVHFAPEMGNTYTNSKITFRVKAYATQVRDNGASVFEVQHWPAVQ